MFQPWLAARAVFENPDDADGPTYRLSWFRSVIGLVALVLLGHQGLSAVVERTADRALTNLFVIVAALLILVPLALLVAKPPARHGMREGLVEFGICLGAAAVTGGVVFYLVRYGPPAAIGVIGNLLFIVGGLWFGIFVIVGVVFANRSMFRVGAVHPQLAPLCSIVVTSAAFVLASADRGWSMSDADATLDFCGWLSTVVIALAEVAILWREGFRPFSSPYSP